MMPATIDCAVSTTWRGIWSCLAPAFMRRALVGLLLIAPMTAWVGVHLIHFRMAFYAEAVSHSAFAGVALGLLLAVSPHWTMPIFGLVVGLVILVLQRRSRLSPDTVIGVVFSAVMAFGLAVVSRHTEVTRNLQRFVYGDILTLGSGEIRRLALMLPVVVLFEIFAYNRLLYLGVHPGLAQAHGVQVTAYQYAFAALVAWLIMMSLTAVGVLLATALLVVPAATARNLARSAGPIFWWAAIVSVTSAGAGLILSAQPWARTATGPTIVLCASAWFLASHLWAVARRHLGG